MNDEIELPEPVAWYRWNDDYRSWSFTLRKPENDAGWEPLHSGGQLRAAIRAERERVRAANTSAGCVKESAESEHERAQAAEPVATMHVGMFGSTVFTGLDAGAKLPEGDYQLYTTPARPARTDVLWTGDGQPTARQLGFMLKHCTADMVMEYLDDDVNMRVILSSHLEPPNS